MSGILWLSSYSMRRAEMWAEMCKHSDTRVAKKVIWLGRMRILHRFLRKHASKARNHIITAYTWKWGGVYSKISRFSWKTGPKWRQRKFAKRFWVTSLEACMKQLISSKLRKEYDRAVCCHPVCLTLCWAYHEKCWVGWIISWDQDSQEEHQQPQICKWYHSNGRKWRGTKEPLDEGEGGQWKSWLKTKY